MIEILLGATEAIMNPPKMAELGLTPKTGFLSIITIVLEGVLTEKGRPGERQIGRQREKQTGRPGDKETRRQRIDKETRRQGDRERKKEAGRQGESPARGDA
jgi:hypothetical protein